MITRRKKAGLFASLPPPWPEDLLPLIRAELLQSNRKLVVLDDDPTGTQTVYGVPVLTGWSVEELKRELAGEGPGFYLLTNTRAFPSEEAVRVTREIACNISLAAQALSGRCTFTVVSRSDSTLRGHFPAEVNALGLALAGTSDPKVSRNSVPPILLIPCFEAGGRFTIGDVHYVAEGDDLVPAAETAFARDSAFGYGHSDLREWVEEKSGGAIAAGAVQSISLAEIRRNGPEAVRDRLESLQNGDVCIVNAITARDLEVVALSSIQVEKTGRTLIYRTAASFVAARMGLEPRPLWQPDAGDERSGGLVVIGSHVPNTTAQLERLLETRAIEPLELCVKALLGPESDQTLLAAAGRVNELLAGGSDVALFTSRALVTGKNTAETLRIGARVSSALVEIVRALKVRPRFLVAKGGITSSDLATAGLGVKRAMVLGQVLPGVPVWELGAESKFPRLPYIVFPGNVGGPDSLHELISKFEPVMHP
jgi:uncharacterized protein YgbK (DUF1537 family)